ncbi:hypothetical protein EDB81DRAFT_824890 [Dactylonectria macrodidyma]|uniref:Uncharacterized protein n=1 Tax=Dactylonectria macrodidyma TaxID=307937 RepID=A0A9P9D6M4_9HYPO|nr:hypothetical protein EDB81DRAFT_824890 [Dactylonectria macrodidyma]
MRVRSCSTENLHAFAVNCQFVPPLIHLHTTLDMTFEASSTTATPEGSTSGSSLLPPVNNHRRRSPRSDAEKLDIVCNFMRNELRWGVADLVTALASSEGSNNTRRKAAFVAAAYKDSEVLKSYFRDADQLWGDGRQSIIEALDLGDNELRREVENLGTIPPFNKFDPTSKNGDFDALDMDQTVRERSCDFHTL